MTIKLVSIPSAEIAQLEDKLNKLFALPDFKGFEIAASFPNSNFAQIVLILQKP